MVVRAFVTHSQSVTAHQEALFRPIIVVGLLLPTLYVSVFGTQPVTFPATGLNEILQMDSRGQLSTSWAH